MSWSFFFDATPESQSSTDKYNELVVLVSEVEDKIKKEEERRRKQEGKRKEQEKIRREQERKRKEQETIRLEQERIRKEQETNYSRCIYECDGVFKVSMLKAKNDCYRRARDSEGGGGRSCALMTVD